MPRGERVFCRTDAWAALVRHAVPWALSGRALHGDVLEIGCGGGAMAAAMLARDRQIRLTAVDLDPEMVATAARRLAAAPGQSHAEVADAAALPFPDGSFDAVVSCLMLHHVGDWERAIAEVGRVLRPGGRFLGYDLVDGRTNRLIHHLDGIHDLRAITETGLLDELDAAGFAMPQVRRDPLRLTLRWVAEKL
jgi:SAM-dependent methyltransferase